MVEGLQGGRFALLHKMHHALVDGIASVQVLETLFSPDPDGGHDVEPRTLEPKPRAVADRGCWPSRWSSARWRPRRWARSRAP